MTRIDGETERKARALATVGVLDGPTASKQESAAVVAAFVLIDELRAMQEREGARACVDTVLKVVRGSWASPQDELDAIYEALRQYGHAV